MIDPPAPHRGFPFSKRRSNETVSASAMTGGSIGVAAGLWLGDPDVDAVTRLTQAPFVKQMSSALDSGLVIAPDCLTVFNSQNTAFVREIAPAMMVLANVGRYDDIWASLIAQRIMRERGLLVHFGKPYVWQERNQHDLWRNLEDEIFGMKNSDAFSDALFAMDIGQGSVVEQLRRIYSQLEGADFLPETVIKTGHAWCRDIEAAYAAA